MSKEGMTSSLHCEVHADCFLWHARNCAPQTHSTDTNICADILQQDVWQKWPEKWHNGNLFHHHHNAPVHPLSVQEFLANNGMTVNLHPLDSGCGTLGFFFFSFSQNWRWCWEEGDFMTSAWFKNGRLRFQSSEHRMLQNAFKNDTITRLTEFSCKGITLKGTEWNSMWMMLPLKKLLTGNFLITLCIFSLQKFTCLHILCNYHLLVKDCLRGNIWGI
jgi:hypothetical protein